MTQILARCSGHDFILRPGIWALFCVRRCVPQQLGDTPSHTNQCPDSGRQKKAVPENSLATRTISIEVSIILEKPSTASIWNCLLGKICFPNTRQPTIDNNAHYVSYQCLALIGSPSRGRVAPPPSHLREARNRHVLAQGGFLAIAKMFSRERLCNACRGCPGSLHNPEKNPLPPSSATLTCMEKTRISEMTQGAIFRRGFALHTPEKSLLVPCGVVGADGEPTIDNNAHFVLHQRLGLIGFPSCGRRAPPPSHLREARSALPGCGRLAPLQAPRTQEGARHGCPE